VILLSEETKKNFLEHNKKFHDEVIVMAKKKNKFFTSTIRDVIILAMSYAVRKRLKPIELKTGEKKQSIRIKEVIHDKHRFMFQILVYWYTKDLEKINEESILFDFAERYANAGLIELIENEEIMKEDYPSYNLANFALED